MIITSRHWGDARSGIPIRSYQTEDLEYIKEKLAGLSCHDHFDAHAVFQWLLVEASRKFGVFSAEMAEFALMSAVHEGFLTEEFMAAEKAHLSITTSLGLAAHGKSLLKSFFVE